jgi:multiple sugar transport system substrate-binding protein
MSEHWDDQPDASRRRLLQAGAGAIALGAIPGVLSAQAQAPFDWKRFKGEKIEILLVKSPRGDLLTKYHKEFEDLTGIEVGAEMVPEQQQRQKAVIEFNSGNPTFDVIALSYHVQKRQFAKNNWLTDLRPINDKSMARRSSTSPTSPRAAPVRGRGRRPGHELALNPIPGRSTRRSRRQRRRLSEDLRRNGRSGGEAQRSRQGRSGSSGAVSRTPTCRWTSFPLGYGGGFVDAKGKLLTDTPEAIEAAKMYSDAARQIRTAGCGGLQLNEAQSLFLQGKAAMWLDGIGFAQPLEDPTKSRIVGKVGYGVMPAGPKAQVSALFADGEGVSTYSKKKGPAWFYIQWASNKANQTRMLQAAAGAPVRNSAYAAAQKSSDFKAPKEWVECMLTSASIAQPGLPIIAPVTEFRDVFGVALTNMINGADPATELKKATTEFQPVLDKSEKG